MGMPTVGTFNKTVRPFIELLQSVVYAVTELFKMPFTRFDRRRDCWHNRLLVCLHVATVGVIVGVIDRTTAI